MFWIQSAAWVVQDDYLLAFVALCLLCLFGRFEQSMSVFADTPGTDIMMSLVIFFYTHFYTSGRAFRRHSAYLQGHTVWMTNALPRPELLPRPSANPTAR